MENFGTMHVFCIIDLQSVLYGWTRVSTCIYRVRLATLLVLNGWTIMLTCMFPVWLYIQVCNLSYMVGQLCGYTYVLYGWIYVWIYVTCFVLYGWTLFSSCTC